MVDVEASSDGHVELFGHQLFNKMPRQFRMPLHNRHRARSPALISRLELLTNADGEGGI